MALELETIEFVKLSMLSIIIAEGIVVFIKLNKLLNYLELTNHK